MPKSGEEATAADFEAPPAAGSLPSDDAESKIVSVVAVTTPGVPDKTTPPPNLFAAHAGNKVRACTHVVTFTCLCDLRWAQGLRRTMEVR